jgi:drug/metabolite transporter (DMT)-like permease
MSSPLLYAACVLIWGSTWIAITFQLGRVPPAVSVAYRFGLAATILLAYCAAKGLPMRFSQQSHAWIALQGFFMFGANYVLVYLSETSISSGLTAVLFSSIVFWNLIGMRIFHGAKVRAIALAGAVLGVTGVALVFWPELGAFKADGVGLRGVGYGLAATLSASFGNMVATRNHRHGLPVMPQNAFGMLYGTLFVVAFIVLTGQPFTFEPTLSYVSSLIYLALFGSVLAFTAYLTLLGRIGADRAGYTAVAIPVVALLLSALFEGFHWTIETSLGVLLCVLGNVLVLKKGKP